MSERKLKPGWQKWRFDQMAVNVNDRIDDPSKAGVECYVGLEHLDPESLKIRRWGSPADVEATKLKFRKGDIIFGRRRAYQRKLAVADFDGICSAHAMVLRARSEVVLPEFLPFFMQSDLFMNRAQEISVGSLSPTINWKTLAAQEFALPPVEEQARIISALAAARDVVEERRNLAQEAGVVYLSLLRFLFGAATALGDQGRSVHLAEMGSSWRRTRLGDLFSLQLGKMSSKAAREAGDQAKYIKNNNVLWGRFDLSDLSSMGFSKADRQKFALRPGDLLVCEGGEIGRAAIWQSGMPSDVYYQKALHRLRPKSHICAEFLFHYLRYASISGELSSLSSGSTIPHLPAEKLLLLRIPVPPEDDQKWAVQLLSLAHRTSNVAANGIDHGLIVFHALLRDILGG